MTDWQVVLWFQLQLDPMHSQVSSKGISARFVLGAGVDSSALKWALEFLTNA